MNIQDMFDLVSNHMILQGNKWGNFFKNERKWGYINPENPCERCVKGLFMDKERSEVLHRENQFVTWVNLVQDGIGRRLTSQESLMLTQCELIFEKHRYEFCETRLIALAEKLGLKYKLKESKVIYGTSNKETMY